MHSIALPDRHSILSIPLASDSLKIHAGEVIRGMGDTRTVQKFSSVTAKLQSQYFLDLLLLRV